jgi:hypothetical protein
VCGWPWSSGSAASGEHHTVGVEGFAWYRHEQTVDAGGIGWEFEQRAKSMGAAVPESQSLSYELDSEGFKLVADRLVEEAGIHAMLHRQFVAPLMDGDSIIGIVTESKAGREAILARRVVDATGDADVATRAGAPVHKTPAEEMMAASVMFHLAGVDKAAFLKGVAEDPQTYRDWAAGEFAAETDEKDADLYSPYLGKPFAKGHRGRRAPEPPEHDRRHLGRDARHRRADLHEPGPPRRLRRHRPRQSHPLRDRRSKAGHAGDRGAAPLHTGL